MEISENIDLILITSLSNSELAALTQAKIKNEFSRSLRTPSKESKCYVTIPMDRTLMFI